METAEKQNLPQTSLKIKLINGNSSSSTKLNRENSMSNTVEDYHGGSSVSVPFKWETQPGTPKIKFHHDENQYVPPPLTPPPSYFSTPSRNPLNKSSNKPNFLSSIFPKRKMGSPRSSGGSSSLSPSSSSSSNSSSSAVSKSYSVPCSPMTPIKSRVARGGRVKERSDQRLSFDSKDDDDDDEEYESPVWTLSFRRRRPNHGFRGCYSFIIKLLLKDLH